MSQRKSLIPQGSILPPAAPPEDDLLSRVIQKNSTRRTAGLPHEHQSPSVDTDLRNPVSTEALTDVREDASTEGAKEGSKPVTTDVNKPVVQQGRKYAGKGGRKAVKTQARQEARESARTDSRSELPKGQFRNDEDGSPGQEAAAAPEPIPSTVQSAPDLPVTAPSPQPAPARTPSGAVSELDAYRERVRAGMASRETLIGGVKSTIEMSPDLSMRLKRYLLEHGGGSIRQIALVLIEEHLKLEGF
ncbi:MAG: hypothetical protein ABIY70_08905 [Capsulimonas sp.]|uniref:hypothetical protein n=1 Tax=Capsulimonas sp. TaxID=2494211 RepID=UPI003264D047